MRRKFYLLALIIIAFVGLTMTDSNAEYLCGDANSDGMLNVSDAVFIINYVFIGGSPAPDPDCCETDCPPIMTDIDGNTYFTVKIGDQCWMAQNLRVSHYRNGSDIFFVSDATTWQDLSVGAWCCYDNDVYYCAEYGYLYNWYGIADSRNIAPEGWHVPTDAEWKQLEVYLGMSEAEADAAGWRGTDEGGKLKEIGTRHWLSPNLGATNETVFTALGAGIRSYDGTYDKSFRAGNFWSSTDYSGTHSWTREMIYTEKRVARNYFNKHYGLSVRCIKD